MKKKVNGKVVKQDIPKGFRLNKEVKDILIKRVCYEKHFSRLKFLLRREKYLFYQVAEHIFPTTVKETIRELYNTLPMKVEIPITSRITINGQRGIHLGNETHLPSALRQLFWSFRYNTDTETNMRVLGFPRTELDDEELLSYKAEVPCSAGNNLMIYMDNLSVPLRRAVAEHERESDEFNEEFDKFHSLVQEAVYGCKSVKQLKEYGDKVYDLLVPIANNLKPPCSDVDVADAHAQMEKLL